MSYCLNPACDRPENPDNHSYCHGCGEVLANSSQGYLFRVHYHITKCLGEGAFGRTYLAADTDLMGEPRVIKKLIASAAGSMQAKIQELFLREAQQLYSLAHPQIPKLYAYFEQNNALYLVQQFIEGDDLFKEFCGQGIFSEDKIKALLQGILPVLDYLHSNRVLHRDIKPDNIMRDCRTGKLILIDFGGAKQTSTTLQSQPGTMIYTPGYAAIEHMMGNPCAASDIYSLGATCVRLLTGCFAVTDEFGNIQDELYDKGKLQWRWREYLQNKGKTINEELASILDKMLAMMADNRYQSAQEVLSILNPKPSVISQPNIQLSPPPIPAITPPVSQPTPISYPAVSLKKFQFDIVTVTVTVEEKQGFWGNEKEKVVQTNRRGGEAEYFSENMNNVPLEMISIPGGSFLMGTENKEIERLCKKFGGDWFKREHPQHKVTVPPFFMGKYSVTQAQWEAGANLPKINRDLKSKPSHFSGNNLPVEKVSWYDAVEFCERLSQKTGKIYRLLSEAEWEYACRAISDSPSKPPLIRGVGGIGVRGGSNPKKGGENAPFHFGETITTDLANYHGNYVYGDEPKGIYRQKTTPVGTFSPNAFGLYDMHGNVWEWCADSWHENYNSAPLDGSAWADNNNRSQNSRFVLRGGSWGDYPPYCRSAYRHSHNPGGYDSYGIGFRVAVSLPRTS